MIIYYHITIINMINTIDVINDTDNHYVCQH